MPEPAPSATPPTPPPASVEDALWTGHTSQWVHFWYYFFCALLAIGALAGVPFTGGLSAAALVIPLFMGLLRWWMTRTTVYELTTQRLKIYHGILTRRLDEVELYRVKDYVLEQPLLLRLLGLGHVTLVTSDAITPSVKLRAIARAAIVREQLRTAVQAERDRKRVREIDVDETSPPEGLKGLS
jgi:uncharacterized membrane protein YdbT with pleckstrin-like domain